MRKDALLLVGAILIAVILGWWFFLAGPSVDMPNPAVAGASTEVRFTELASGSSSSIGDRKNFIIHTDEELRQLWKIIGNTDEPPFVDFERSEVIAVFAGEELTAGYTISVTDVSDTETTRMVAVTLGKPGGSCVLEKQTTRPYQVIEFPKTDLPLSHTDTVQTVSCL